MRLDDMIPGKKQSTWSATFLDTNGKWVRYLYKDKFQFFFEDQVQEVCDILNQSHPEYRMFRHDTTRVL